MELANEMVDNGVEIDGVFHLVLPLSTPSKKVIPSNVPPFIKDEVLSQTLSRYGKLVSQIKNIAITSKSPRVKHILSFRRFVYMVLKDNNDLDLTLNVKVEDFNYVICATTTTRKCFGCGLSGHLVRACPEKCVNPKNGNNVNKAAGNEVTAGEGVGVDGAHTPGEGAAVPLLCRHLKLAPHQGLGVQPGEEEKTEPELCDKDTQDSTVSLDSVDPSLADEVGDDSSHMDMEENVFKVPQRKRRRNRPHAQAKRKDVAEELNSGEVESESEASDCSITCSINLSGFSSHEYSVDDIKASLKKTKHARNVRIDGFFPDVEQFIKKTRGLWEKGVSLIRRDIV